MRKWMFVLVFGVSVGCAGQDYMIQPEQRPRLEPRSAVIEVGQTVEFKAASPYGVVPQPVIRNPTVLDWLGSGRFAGRAEGETWIVVSTTGGNDSVHVEVKPVVVCTPSLWMSPSTDTLQVGDTLQMRAGTGCEEATELFTFTSSSGAISVSDRGLAKAERVGSAVITARLRSDSSTVVTSVLVVEAAAGAMAIPAGHLFIVRTSRPGGQW